MQSSGDPNFDLILSDHPTVVPSPSPCPIGVVSVSATTAKEPFQPWPWLSEPRAGLGSDLPAQPLSKVPAAVHQLSTWRNSLVGGMLTRPGSCGRKTSCFLPDLEMLEAPTTDIRDTPPSFLPSGGQAPVRNVCFPVGRSGSPGMSRKSCTLHLTGLGTGRDSVHPGSAGSMYLLSCQVSTCERSTGWRRAGLA